MSRRNKVNPDYYTGAGRLTPDDLARELRRQTAHQSSHERGRARKAVPPWMAHETSDQTSVTPVGGAKSEPMASPVEEEAPLQPAPKAKTRATKAKPSIDVKSMKTAARKATTKSAKKTAKTIVKKAPTKTAKKTAKKAATKAAKRPVKRVAQAAKKRAGAGRTMKTARKR